MSIKLEQAVKYVKPLKVFLFGPTFSGKTLSSLLMANGVVQSIRKCKEEEAWKHIVLIDTEYGRGALYSNVGAYNYLQIQAPFTTEKLDEVLKELETMPDIDCIIIDSMTHFWSKEGGLLEQKSIVDSAGGNTFSNWLNIGMKLNTTIELILKSSKYYFITARAKSDTVLTADSKGKMVPKTFGLKPDLRDGFDFECDIVFNVDKTDHTLLVEKGLTGMEPIYPMATPDLGKTLYNFAIDHAMQPIRAKEDICKSIRTLSARNQELINFVGNKLSGRKLDELKIDELLSLEQSVKALVHKQQKK